MLGLPAFVESEPLAAALLAAPAGCRHDAVRTLVNGWTAAARMHTEPRPCIYCNEPGGDDIKHYACECERLAVAMDTSVFTPPGPLAWLQRFGVSAVDPCRAVTAGILLRVASRIPSLLSPCAQAEHVKKIDRARCA